MTIHLPKELENSVRAEVLSGHFSSEEDMVAAAVREYFQRHRQDQTASAATHARDPILGSIYDVARRAGLTGGIKEEPETPDDLTEEEQADQEMQRRLFDAGLLSEIKPPLRDLTPYQNRKAVPIQGEPLSETVIRERR